MEYSINISNKRGMCGYGSSLLPWTLLKPLLGQIFGGIKAPSHLEKIWDFKWLSLRVNVAGWVTIWSTAMNKFFSVWNAWSRLCHLSRSPQDWKFRQTSETDCLWILAPKSLTFSVFKPTKKPPPKNYSGVHAVVPSCMKHCSSVRLGHSRRIRRNVFIVTKSSG